jgi:hypothetical protein
MKEEEEVKSVINVTKFLVRKVNYWETLTSGGGWWLDDDVYVLL